MNNADDSTPKQEFDPEETDLGPEPDWLSDDILDAPATDAEPDQAPEAPAELVIAPPPASRPAETAEMQEPARPTNDVQPLPPPALERTTTTPQPATGPRPERPWLWGAVPLIFLAATALIAWFGTTQTLNNLTTWNAIRIQDAPLLPARWAMTIWWAAVPLLALFLIYGALPAGRDITRIKLTGPLITVGLVATGIWVFAQHWQWEVLGIVMTVLTTAALFTAYLLVVLNRNITNLRQRFIALAPLSATLAYSLMLLLISWQGYSSQPFGERGTSVLLALLVVIVAAVLAFFLRDGLFALVLAIWFAGVVHQQWGDDTVISLVAAIALLLSGALAVLGTILATESHRPSLTASVESRKGRVTFFRKKEETPPE